MLRFLGVLGTLSAALLLIASLAQADDILSAGYAGSPVKGNWSDTLMWLGHVVPRPADNVIIWGGDTIFIDVDVQVVDLTIGDGTSGALIFNSTKAVKMSVTGNLTVNTGGTFRNTTGPETVAPVIDTLFIHGDFSNSGAVLDFRRGSGPNYGVCYVVFVDSMDSHFTSAGPYSSSNNEFNGITINKSGSGRVILGSDIFLAGGSSTYPATTTYLDLRHGLLVTGSHTIISQSTASSPAPIVGGSSESYVLGSLGRGVSSGSTGVTKVFPVGDELGYRPFKARNASPGNATGHVLKVRCIHANPNPGGATLPPEIDKIATVRYYQLTYDTINVQSAPNMYFDRFFPSYGQQDGVAAGNSNLRVAYSTDTLKSWMVLGQVVRKDTTEFTDPAAYWNADSLPSGSYVNLVARGPSAYVAIARAAGTIENTLEYTPTAVREGDQLPREFSLSQNYPNPFNPSTTIKFSLPEGGHVILEIYNVLGQSVGRLVDGDLMAGSYTATYDAKGLSSGVYFYRLVTETGVMGRKMLLAK